MESFFVFIFIKQKQIRAGTVRYSFSQQHRRSRGFEENFPHFPGNVIEHKRRRSNQQRRRAKSRRERKIRATFDDQKLHEVNFQRQRGKPRNRFLQKRRERNHPTKIPRGEEKTKRRSREKNRRRQLNFGNAETRRRPLHEVMRGKACYTPPISKITHFFLIMCNFAVQLAIFLRKINYSINNFAFRG